MRSFWQVNVSSCHCRCQVTHLHGVIEASRSAGCIAPLSRTNFSEENGFPQRMNIYVSLIFHLNMQQRCFCSHRREAFSTPGPCRRRRRQDPSLENINRERSVGVEKREASAACNWHLSPSRITISHKSFNIQLLFHQIPNSSVKEWSRAWYSAFEELQVADGKKRGVQVKEEKFQLKM